MAGAPSQINLDRVSAAFDFRNPLDELAVAECLENFFGLLKAPKMKIREARNLRAARAARAALDARAARAARDALDALGAGSYWWNFYDASWLSCSLLGAMQLKDQSLTELLLPIFNGLEKGLWLFLVGADAIYWIRQPKLHLDDRNRCHRDGAAAFVLPGEKSYFWHGTLIPELWGRTNSEHWKPKWLLETSNAEHRRVLMQGIGYERIMDELGSKLVHRDGDMELRRLTADVDVEPVVLLKVVCPSTRSLYALRVPPNMTDCETARRWTLGDEQVELVKES
jgi:hypothetical protein